MTTYPLMQVDAFTNQQLSGNPCAIVFDAADLSPETMVAIAREMNLAETAFVMPSDQADFRVRYFTPAEEIPLAGHPTIATTQALIDSERIKLSSKRTVIKLELQVGVIDVEVTSVAGQVERIMMSQKKPEFFSSYDPDDIVSVFNIDPDALLADFPIQTVSTGTRQLMIPLNSLDALRHVDLDFQRYRDLRAKGDFFSPHIFCLQGITEQGDTFARHFGVPPDLPEDPFTGSATGGMAAYLWHYGLINEPHFIAEQGHWMGRPGQAQVEIIGPRNDIETVRVGGQAVTVFSGTLTL